MNTITLLLAFLPAFSAQAKAEEPNPEPPPPAPVTVKLVAKKKTYKLDLGGLTAAKFRQRVKAGNDLPQAPTLDMVLVITNNSKNPIRIRSTGSTTRVMLEVTGPDVVQAAINEALPRPKISYVILASKQSLEMPVDRLASKISTIRYNRHYWTEPGEYKVTASIYTSVQMDYNANVAVRLEYKTLKARPITVKVEK
jgi:hypothetical protein